MPRWGDERERRSRVIHAQASGSAGSAPAGGTPGLFTRHARLIDIEEAWVGGCRAAVRFLQDAGVHDTSSGPCLFSLDDLLAADFYVETAVGRIAAG